MSDERIEGRRPTGSPEPPHTGQETHVDHPGASPEGQRVTETAPSDPNTESGGGDLFDQREVADFSARWEDIQVRFVDQPQESVAAADKLVDDVVDAVTTRMGEQRRQLESLWQSDEEVSTEQLRQSLQRYHALFDRLLSTRSGRVS